MAHRVLFLKVTECIGNRERYRKYKLVVFITNRRNTLCIRIQIKEGVTVSSISTILHQEDHDAGLKNIILGL